MSISQLVLVSRETRTVLTAGFLKNTRTEKMVDGQGNLMNETARTYRSRLCFTDMKKRKKKKTEKKRSKIDKVGFHRVL